MVCPLAFKLASNLSLAVVMSEQACADGGLSFHFHPAVSFGAPGRTELDNATGDLVMSGLSDVSGQYIPDGGTLTSVTGTGYHAFSCKR
jgi:hypothetical protein